MRLNLPIAELCTRSKPHATATMPQYLACQIGAAMRVGYTIAYLCKLLILRTPYYKFL